MSLFKQNEYFYRVKFFLTELNFLKGDANIYFEYITLFEKKKKMIFTEKNKFFVKIIHIFFLKIYIFFQIVSLHLKNHSFEKSRNMAVENNLIVTFIKNYAFPYIKANRY